MSVAEKYLETISTLESEVTALTDQVQAFQQDQGTAAKRVLSLLEEKRAVEERAQQLTHAHQELLRKTNDREGTIADLKEKLKSSTTEKEATLQRIQDLEVRLAAEQEQVAELRKQLDGSVLGSADLDAEKKRLQSNVDSHLQKIASLEEALSVESHGVKKREEALLLANASLERFGEEIASLKEQIESQQERSKRLEEELRQAKEELQIETGAHQQASASAAQTVRDLETEKDKLLGDITVHEQRHKDAALELENQTARFHEIDKKLAEALALNKYLTETLQATQNEYKADKDTSTLRIADLSNLNTQLEKALKEHREELLQASQHTSQLIKDHEKLIHNTSKEHQDEVRKLQDSLEKQIYTLQAKNLSLEAALGLEREEKGTLRVDLEKKQAEDAELQGRIVKIREEVSTLREHLEKSKELHANQVAILESDFAMQRQALESKVTAQRAEAARLLEIAKTQIVEAQDSASKKERTLQQEVEMLRAENAALEERFLALEKKAHEQSITLNVVNREHRDVRAVAIDLQERLQKIGSVHKQDLDKQNAYILELQQRLAQASSAQAQADKNSQASLLELKRFRAEAEKLISELRQEVISLKIKLRTGEKVYS